MRTADLSGLVADVARAHRLIPEEVWDTPHRVGGPHHRAHTARRVVYLVLRMHGRSLPQIGATMDRHHATVLYHLRLANDADRRLATELALKWARKDAA